MPDRESFEEVVLRHRLYSNRRNLSRFLASVFGPGDLAGWTVLDIGGGMGLLALAAVQRGAARAVVVEPEEAGGTAGARTRFEEVRAALALEDRVAFAPVPLQAYDPAGLRFDLAIAHNSVNHLNEAACAVLHRDPAARAAYREIFARLRAMMNPGGRLVLFDCARRNLWGDLGLRNPLMPAIEWHKHQQPRLWMGLLAEAGFTRPALRWTTLHTLGACGRALLGNGAAAYLLTGHFRLEMRAADEAGSPGNPSETLR